MTKVLKDLSNYTKIKGTAGKLKDILPDVEILKSSTPQKKHHFVEALNAYREIPSRKRPPISNIPTGDVTATTKALNKAVKAYNTKVTKQPKVTMPRFREKTGRQIYDIQLSKEDRQKFDTGLSVKDIKTMKKLGLIDNEKEYVDTVLEHGQEYYTAERQKKIDEIYKEEVKEYQEKMKKYNNDMRLYNLKLLKNKPRKPAEPTKWDVNTALESDLKMTEMIIRDDLAKLRDSQKFEYYERTNKKTGKKEKVKRILWSKEGLEERQRLEGELAKVKYYYIKSKMTVDPMEALEMSNKAYSKKYKAGSDKYYLSRLASDYDLSSLSLSQAQIDNLYRGIKTGAYSDRNWSTVVQRAGMSMGQGDISKFEQYNQDIEDDVRQIIDFID